MKISTTHLQANGFLKLNRLYKFLPTGFGMRLLMILVLCLGVGKSWGQTNPAAFALSGGSFTFASQTATNTTYPANMQGWTTGTNNIATLTTAAPGADQALVASGTAATSGLSNLGVSGFNFLSTGSSPNQQVGAICVALNATGRSSLLVTWTAADQTSSLARQMNMTLQYRLATTGTFTTVASSTYTTSASAQAAATTFTNIALPSACDNQALVQIRWITYESAAQSGGRDALRLDDITVSSTSSGLTPPTLNAAAGATVDAPYNVTFTDDATWRAAITSITVGGTTLTAGSSISAGQITFTPSASTPTTLLQTSGSKSIVVIATGYNNATVTQAIGVGAANKLTMNTQPTAPVTNGAVLATQPKVNIVDQYGNATTSTANIDAAVGAGTWTLGGTTSVAAVGGTTTFSGLTATSAAAVTGATISFTSSGLTGVTSNSFNIPAPAPANDVCAAAIALTINAAAINGTLAAATATAGNTFAYEPTKNDVWYTFTPGITGNHTIAINFSTGPDIDFDVFTGPSCPTTGTAPVIAHSTVVTSETVTASFTTGTTYFIRIIDYNTNAGAFNISVTGPCTSPTTQASALITTAPGVSQLTANWTSGNGDGTMIVIRPTAQALVAPSNGSSYTANTVFASAGQINTNNRVVFRGLGTTVTATGLTAATQYTVTAYEYTSATNCYNLTGPLSSSIYTLSNEPTAHAAAFTSPSSTQTSITLNFSAASTITNAAGYIILQLSGAVAPTGLPSDATAYSLGNIIGDGTVAAIITSTAATSTTISGLSNNSTFSFTLIPFGYNGTNAGTYNYYTAATIPSTSNTTLALAAPTVTTPTFAAVTNTTATLGGNVTSDGGSAITVRGIVWSATGVNNDPLIGGASVTDIISGTATTGVFTVAATSLPVATSISFKAYAINAQGTTYTAPVSTFTTLDNPTTTTATAITFGTVTPSSIQLSWTNGDGANRIVVARLTATTRVAPANGTGYTVTSSSFTDGGNSTTGSGNIVIYNGSGSTVTVTSLSAATSYTFDVYEYNGSGATANYGAVASGTKSTLATEPTVQASGLSFTNVSATGFTINWTKGGDGVTPSTGSLVIVKDITAVDAIPVDGTSYSASVANVFGTGSEITTGNFVVYRATASTIAVTGLIDGHTYHVAVFASNGTAGSGLENYLTSVDAVRGSQTAQTPTYYSKGSLDPGVLSSWNSNRDGVSGTAPASFTTNAAYFVIQNTHTMTTTAAFSLGTANSKLQIENGGVLSAGHAISIASGTTFQIDNGGKYSQTAGITMSTIFGGTEAFAPNSNFEYLVNPGSTALPAGAGYGNLSITGSGVTALGWGGNLTAVQGNLTILGTGSGSTRHALTNNTNITVNIGGDFIVTGGNFWLSSGSGTCIVNLTGNLLVNGGVLDIANGSGEGTINVGGNVTISSGTLTEGGSTTISKIVFNKTGSQDFIIGGTISNIVNFEVANGSVTNLGTNVISGTGAVTVNNGGTLKVASLNAGGAIAGNISATGGLVLIAGSTVEYNGAAAQFMTARTFSNLTINNAAGVTMNASSNVTVGAALALTSGNLSMGANTLTLNGAVSGSGTLTGSSISNLTIGGSALNQSLNFTTGSSLNNLILSSSSASATLGTDLDVYGNIKLNDGALNLNSKNVVLKSNTTNTATIDKLNSGGTNLTGANNVTMERWIPLRNNNALTGGRAYRVLGSTVTTTTSINANWQEGLMNNIVGVNIVPDAPYTNFGVQITGTTGNTGLFDVTQNNQPSLFTFTPGSDINGSALYPAVTSTSGILNAKTGYFLYIRGDRNTNMQVPYNPGGGMPTSSTTLRAKGQVQQGDIAYTISNVSGHYTLITNPFPSPIDWNLVSGGNTNISDTYTFWNSNQGSEGGYIVVPIGVANYANRYIQPGEAFFVLSNGTGATVTITEAMKAVGNNNNGIFRPVTSYESFAIELMFTEANNNIRHAADEAVVRYGNYVAGINADDIDELTNWNENIAISRSNTRLALESRPVIVSRDTIPLYMNGLRQTNYEWVFTPSMFTNTGLKAELVDNFLNTRTVLSVIDSVVVPFTVTANPASAAANRFMVVFGPFSPLAIDVITIKAQAKNNGVQVDWTAKTEKDMDRYELERSFAGNSFNNIKTIASMGNSQVAVNYSWRDINPQVGNNYYRIKAIDKAGLVKYTGIVKVGFGNTNTAITVSPNPVTGNILNLKLSDLPKGSYTLQLFNTMGQQVLVSRFNHSGGSVNQPVNLTAGMAAGTYQLVLSDGETRLRTTIIKN